MTNQPTNTTDDQSVTTKPSRIYAFQKTELGANMNRWYHYEVYDQSDGRIHVIGKYGRVGDKGNIKDWGLMDQSSLDKMIRERVSLKHYKPVDLHALPADDNGSTNGASAAPVLSVPTASIVALIFKEAGEAIAQYLNTTVDQLSQLQITEARNLLANITSTFHPRGVQALVQDYYNTIPTKLPRRIDPVQLVRDFDAAQEEVRLQQLEAAIATYAGQRSGQSQVTSLGAKIDLLPPGSQEHRSLADYVISTSRGRPRIEGIYSVEIPPERAAYLADRRGKHNRMLLFHGTKNANVRHILKMGLIIPRYATSGRMFGDGIYFADKSSKSQNYCGASGYSSSAPWMMLVSEVSLGRIHKATGAHHYPAAPAGYDSVMGQAGYSLVNNEYIVYSPTQCSVRYLVTFHQ